MKQNLIFLFALKKINVFHKLIKILYRVRKYIKYVFKIYICIRFLHTNHNNQIYKFLRELEKPKIYFRFLPNSVFALVDYFKK